MSAFLYDNMYCGLIRRGDVFLCDSVNGKKKEIFVVVLQDTVLNDGLATVVCTLVHPLRQGEQRIDEIFLDKKETGLGKDSLCVLHHIYTIGREHFIAKKGEVSEKTLRSVYVAVDTVFGRFRDQ